MKKLIITTALVFATIMSTYAQDSIKVYCEIIGRPVFPNATTTGNLNVHVTLDFGQKQDGAIVDERGRDIIFNSMVDAMNFMAEKGWNFLQAYTETLPEGKGSISHWILTKTTSAGENISDEVFTRGKFLRLRKEARQAAKKR